VVLILFLFLDKLRTNSCGAVYENRKSMPPVTEAFGR
jgi:hypothetical protein